MRPITLSVPFFLLTAPAMAAVPQVVTDIPAVGSLVAQVMGDLGAPEVLLDQGANAHNYQLRPSQARALQSADLVFWIEKSPPSSRYSPAAVELIGSRTLPLAEKTVPPVCSTAPVMTALASPV